MLQGVELDGEKLIGEHVHVAPAPMHQCLPHLIVLTSDAKSRPRAVFDPTLPPTQVAEGYSAIDERRADHRCQEVS